MNSLMFLSSAGRYTCHCFPGYLISPTDPSKCVDRDECSDGHRGGCDHLCTNTSKTVATVANLMFMVKQFLLAVGSYICGCRDGYSINPLDTNECIDVDECEGNNGHCSHSCHNVHGNYTCYCPLNLELSDDLRTCVLKDLCGTSNGGCQQLCQHVNGQVLCRCRAGFEVDPRNSSQCVDVDECAINNGGCFHNCSNSVGNFSCSCLPGYIVDPQDRLFCLDVDECAVSNGGCQQNCSNYSE